jgi:hypothetical protein
MVQQFTPGEWNRKSDTSGAYFRLGSSSDTFPCSANIGTAAAVNCFNIEQIRNTAEGAIYMSWSKSAMPSSRSHRITPFSYHCCCAARLVDVSQGWNSGSTNCDWLTDVSCEAHEHSGLTEKAVKTIRTDSNARMLPIRDRSRLDDHQAMSPALHSFVKR